MRVFVRAFVAVLKDQALLVEALEQCGIEVIPLTDDPVIDNMESLHTCQLVVVDDSSPPWVLREVQELSKFVIAYRSLPSIQPVCLLTSLTELQDCAHAAIGLCQMMPVTQDYVLNLAQLKARYPNYRLERVT